MPGGLDLLILSDLEVGVLDKVANQMREGSICWYINARNRRMCGDTHIGFIQGYLEHDSFFDTRFHVISDYSVFLNGRMAKDAGEVALRNAMPTSTHAFCCIQVHSCPTYHSSPLEYLKILESWFVVAQHWQDDTAEFARLRSRFENTFLLVEMGVGREVMIVRGGGKGQVETADKHVPQQEMDTLAFAIVPLRDETKVMALLNSRSVCLQFVDRGGSTGRLLPRENQLARISVLDVGKNRVYELSESYFPRDISSAGNPEEKYDFTGTCRFSCYNREIYIFPSFEEESTDSDEKPVVTVKLDIVTEAHERVEDDEEEEEEDDEKHEFTSVLELWKFLELCLTAELVSHGKE